MLSPTPMAPDYERIESPEVGVLASVNIGDTVLKKGDQYTYPALQLSSDLTQSFGVGGIGNYQIPAQKLVAKGYNEKHIFYAARGMKHTHSMTGTVSLAGGICVSRTDPEELRFSSDLVLCDIRIQTKPELIPTTATAQDSPSFVQELIYNGRVGDSVKFLYREFSDNMARPAFSQEAQYDLSESQIIGFKNARLEIVDATNTELKYRVLESFPDYE